MNNQQIFGLDSALNAAIQQESKCVGNIQVSTRLIIEVAERIAELEAQSQWISVEDRLPVGCSCNYLTYRHSAPTESRVSSTWYDPNYNGWSGKYSVTHWMPLPTPPKEQGE